jgi:hypothetical protein
VIRALLEELASGELFLHVAATEIADGTHRALRQLSPSSTLSKIPDDILRSYDRSSPLRELLDSPAPPMMERTGRKRSPRRTARPTSARTSSIRG